MSWTERYLDLSAGTNGDGLGTSTPWNSFANAVTGLGTISAPTRVRVRGSGSLSAALTINPAGTSAANPLWWAGCDSSWDVLGPGDPLTGYPTLAAGTHQITASSARQAFSYLSVTSSSTTTGGAWRITGNENQLVRLKIVQSGSGSAARCLTLESGRSAILGCAFSGSPSDARTIDGSSFSANDNLIYANTMTGGQVGYIGLSRCALVFNVVSSPGEDGIAVTGSPAVVVIGNTIYSPGRHGVRANESQTFVLNNLIVNANGTGAHPIVVGNNTTAGFAPIYANGWFNVTNNSIGQQVQDYHPFGIGLLAADPLENPGSGDFALKAASAARMAGFPGKFLF